jgi:hypothetical protein
MGGLGRISRVATNDAEERKFAMFRFLVTSTLLLILAACTTPGARVVTFDSLPASFKGQSVFAMVVVSSKLQGMESRGFQRRLETKLSSAGFRVVGEEERPDYIAMLTYGRFSTGEMLFGLHSEETSILSEGDVAGQGDVTSLQGPSQQVLLRLHKVNHGRRMAKTEQYADGSIFRRGLIVADTCREFSAVMDAMLDSLFADFPGETASDKEVVGARLDSLCR